MALSISDAVAHYRSVSEDTHKFWGYFQAIAAGSAAFAWSRDYASLPLFAWLTIAFGIFAVLNLRLVVGSQASAVIAERCIKEFLRNNPAEAPQELAPMIADIRPGSALSVGVWHAGLAAAVMAAIWWRYFTLC